MLPPFPPVVVVVADPEPDPDPLADPPPAVSAEQAANVQPVTVVCIFVVCVLVVCVVVLATVLSPRAVPLPLLDDELV